MYVFESYDQVLKHLWEIEEPAQLFRIEVAEIFFQRKTSLQEPQPENDI